MLAGYMKDVLVARRGGLVTAFEKGSTEGEAWMYSKSKPQGAE